MVWGKAMIEEAKITGMTPLVFTRRGRWVDWPPYMRRPTTRLAYCTVMRRWPRSTNTMARDHRHHHGEQEEGGQEVELPALEHAEGVEQAAGEARPRSPRR